MRAAWLALALAACGDNEAGPCPDGGPACGTACIAELAGNFDASSTSAHNCASVGAGSGSQASDVVLAFQIAETGLDAPIAVSIDVGVEPTAGTYSSETTSAWSVQGTRTASLGDCAYSAGTTAVPTGSFAMTLTAIDPGAGTAHGELAITATVQALESVDCGSGDTETIDLRF
ncbi:MAG TPA: hypothetical protein VMJ10_36920 [Kofleriaceae bacterium]|nr:hypothetical protein [Kofleriaceae bacterium]